MNPDQMASGSTLLSKQDLYGFSRAIVNILQMWSLLGQSMQKSPIKAKVMRKSNPISVGSQRGLLGEDLVKIYDPAYPNQPYRQVLDTRKRAPLLKCRKRGISKKAQIIN